MEKDTGKQERTRRITRNLEGFIPIAQNGKCTGKQGRRKRRSNLEKFIPLVQNGKKIQASRNEEEEEEEEEEETWKGKMMN